MDGKEVSKEESENSKKQKLEFCLDKDQVKMAIECLPTVMDLTRWLNGELSKAVKLSKPFTEEHSKKFISELKVESLWDAVAMFVFKALHLPPEKAALLMYSNLSAVEKEAVIIELEHYITKLIQPEEKDKKKKADKPEQEDSKVESENKQKKISEKEGVV